jgi:signal transduction histidine kinase
MRNPVIRSRDTNILLVALLYYLSAEVGFYLGFYGNPVLPVWPPAGIALALMIIYGRSVWPGIAIGTLVIAIKNYWFTAISSVQLIMLVSAMITAGAIFEAIAGQITFRKLVKGVFPFSTTINAFYFVFIAFFISWISSGFTAITLSLSGVVPRDLFVTDLFELWARNVVGILLFTPLFLCLPKLKLSKISWPKVVELASVIACFAVVLFLFNFPAFQSVFPYAIPFVVIPFLLWLAFRFEVITAIMGSLAVSLAAIFYTSAKIGPLYLSGTNNDSILLLQVYVAVISVSTLVLAAAVQERQKAQNLLKKFNENLESLVGERTHALEAEVQTRKDAQQTLQDTNEELIKRNTELDNFVYSVSHDLRAPIASILGLINLAKKDKAENTKQMFLEMMEKSAQQQDHFIREILDQSRNSRLEVQREAVNFESLIEEIFDQLDYSYLQGKKLKKTISVIQDRPFYSDKWRLKVILNNIISNSIRYKNGRDPEVIIHAMINDHNCVDLTIQDNGRGIKKEHLIHLGKMFYRATDEGAGPGLGLYIVKETVNKLKGSVDITSEEGEGTIVRFEIPETTTN